MRRAFLLIKEHQEILIKRIITLIILMTPLISLIIPTYNAGNTLKDALESIKIQSYWNYEVLVVDGLSNDNTVNIAKNYALNDERIKWISETDHGIYDAMNKGLDLAKGAWVYFMGSDDTLIDDSVLATVFTIADLDKFDVIYGNVISQKLGGRYDGEFSVSKILTKNICHQAIFFKKSVFDKTGKFNLKYKLWADYDHNLKWFLHKGIRKRYVPIDIANYADNGLSSSQEDHAFLKVKTDLFFLYSMNADWNVSIQEFAKNEMKENLRRLKFKKLIRPSLVFIRQKFNL